jgi:hypothetical protein
MLGGMSTARLLGAAAVAAGLLALHAAPAQAQDDPNPGAITFTGGIDFLNAYHFRGIPQDESGLIMWPYGDLGFAVYSGDGGLKSVGVNVGTWNSLHTGDAGLDSASGKLWYESDFYTTLGLAFGGGTSLGITYTAYNSPNGLFATVKELAFKLALDDSAFLGGAAVRPYVLLARELGDAQADGGLEAGTYLELGIAPGVGGDRASLTIPVKVGLSLKDYFEHNMGTAALPDLQDNAFGYFSIAGLVTVPLGGNANIHGGVEVQTFGDTLKAKNAFGDNPLDPSGSAVIGSIGIGFSF